MSNKKLTDNDIIKALECCYTDGGKCEDCPLHKIDACNDVLLGENTLDLINRQKAEIERLNVLANLGNVRANDYRAMRNKLKTANAEIEGLHKTLVFEINSAFDRGKAEAYKEFAEEYKNQIKNYTGKFTEDGFMVSLEAVLSAVDFIKNKLVGGTNVE